MTERAVIRPVLGKLRWASPVRVAAAARARAKAAVWWTAGMARFSVVRSIVALADYTPRPVGVAVVRGFSLAECMVTRRGRAARKEARLVMGKSGFGAVYMAWSWMSVPYVELIDLRRIVRKREDLTKWTVEEVGTEEARRLLDAGQPLLVVGAHFSMTAALPLALTIPGIASVGVVSPIKEFKFTGKVLLHRLAMGMVHGLGEILRPGESQLTYVGRNDVQAALLETLSHPKGVGSILIDNPWEKPNAYVRPFCGWLEHPVPPGAARIARLAQVPVFLMAAEHTGARASRVHCFGPFIPGPVDDVAGDRAFMDQLVDQLEVCIGQLRHQYPRLIGRERRWDERTERWVPLG